MANALNLPIPVTPQYGGTGATNLTLNAVLIGNGASTIQTASLGAGQLLIGTAGAPTATSTLNAGRVVIGGGTSSPTTVGLDSGQLLVGTGVNTSPVPLTLAAHGVVIGEGTASPNTVTLNTGQVLIGQTGADPIAGTISAVTFYQTVTSTPVAMAASTLYYINDTTPSEQVVLNLPASPNLNDTVAVVGLNTSNTAGWQIKASGSQRIQLGSSLSAAGGTLASSLGSSTDAAYLIYAAANLWVVYNAVGLNLIPG